MTNVVSRCNAIFPNPAIKLSLLRNPLDYLSVFSVYKRDTDGTVAASAQNKGLGRLHNMGEIPYEDLLLRLKVPTTDFTIKTLLRH